MENIWNYIHLHTTSISWTGDLSTAATLHTAFTRFTAATAAT